MPREQTTPQEGNDPSAPLLFDVDAFTDGSSPKNRTRTRRTQSAPPYTQLGFESPPNEIGSEHPLAREDGEQQDIRDVSYFCRRVHQQFEIGSEVGQMFLEIYRSFPGPYRYLLDVLLRNDTTQPDDESQDPGLGEGVWYHLLQESYAEIIEEYDSYRWVQEQLSSAKSPCVGLQDLMVADRMEEVDAEYGTGRLFTIDGNPSEYIYDPEVIRLLSKLDEWQMFVLSRFASSWHRIKNDRDMNISEGPESCVRERLFSALWWVEFSMQAEHQIANGLRGAFLALPPSTRVQVLHGESPVPLWNDFYDNMYQDAADRPKEADMDLARQLFVMEQAQAMAFLRLLGNLQWLGDSVPAEFIRSGEQVGGGHNFENARAASQMSQVFGKIIERMIQGMGNDGGLAGKSERARELLGIWSDALGRIALHMEKEPRVVRFDQVYVNPPEGILYDAVEETARGMAYLMVAAHLEDVAPLPLFDFEAKFGHSIFRFSDETAGIEGLFPEIGADGEVPKDLASAVRMSEIRKLIEEISGRDLAMAVGHVRLGHEEIMRETFGIEITEEEVADAKEGTERVARDVTRKLMNGYYRFLMSQRYEEVVRVMNFMMTLCRLFRQDIRGILGGRIMPFVRIPSVPGIADIGDDADGEQDEEKEEAASRRGWGIVDGIILGEEVEAWRDVPDIPFWDYFLREDTSGVVLLEVKSRFTPRDAWRPPATMYKRYAEQIKMYLDDLWRYARSLGRSDLTVKCVKMLHISVAGKYVFTLPVIWGGDGPVLLTRRSDGMTVERFE